VRGWFCAFATMCLFQDWLGRDDYVDYVSNNWISGRVTVPIAVLVLAIALVSYLKEKETA